MRAGIRAPFYLVQAGFEQPPMITTTMYIYTLDPFLPMARTRCDIATRTVALCIIGSCSAKMNMLNAINAPSFARLPKAIVTKVESRCAGGQKACPGRRSPTRHESQQAMVLEPCQMFERIVRFAARNCCIRVFHNPAGSRHHACLFAGNGRSYILDSLVP